MIITIMNNLRVKKNLEYDLVHISMAIYKRETIYILNVLVNLSTLCIVIVMMGDMSAQVCTICEKTMLSENIFEGSCIIYVVDIKLNKPTFCLSIYLKKTQSVIQHVNPTSPFINPT